MDWKTLLAYITGTVDQELLLRIVGALAHLGYMVSDQTVGNILERHGIPPAPERTKTRIWKESIGMHMDVLVATDFFTAEVLTWCGLVMSARPREWFDHTR